MSPRRRPSRVDPDEVRREILEHLDRHPLPPDEAVAPGPRRSVPRERRADPAPAPARPRLMLRKMRVEAAVEQLARFVDYQRHRGTEEVVVVVGKGRGSGPGGPVLGHAVRAWCDAHPDRVAQVGVAPPSEGGEGALRLRLAPRAS